MFNLKNNVSFGGELTRLRKQKGISQFDLTVMMNWSSTSPLIQIEKNRRIPKLETIERLSSCLELDYIQKHYLLGLAGFLLKTEIPQKKQVITTLEHVSSYMCNIQYPSFIVDYKYRFWLFNPAVSVLANGDNKILYQLLSRCFSVFDVYFNSQVGFCQSITNIEQVQDDQIFRFKASNLFRQHEDFYLAYPDCMSYLETEDYTAFEKAWNKIDHNVLVDVKAIQIPDFYNRIEKGDVSVCLNGKDVYFHITVLPILHLGDLFQVVTYVPVDSASLPENKAYIDNICQRNISKHAAPLKIWELINVDQLF